MMTAYPETMTFPAGLATVPELSGLIDATIARFTQEWGLLRLPVTLRFPKELEVVYEAETKQARVRELHFTTAAAAGFMCVTTFTDQALLPDMGWRGLESRLLSSAIFGIAIFFYGRVSGRMREMLLFATTYFALNVIIGVPCLSRAATAPYGMFLCFLAIMYANTTVPFRFRYAWPFSLVSLATIAAYMHHNPVVSHSVATAMMFMGVVGVSFTLIANYRMERSARLGYLLASKEALRLFALNRDRDELATISSTDALTGIANRGHFDRRLTTLFEGGADRSSTIHLIMMDVDFFKKYNDRYGHPAGDACLRSVAAVLLSVMRDKKDFAFRYGGEEFGALLLEVSRSQAEGIAERIRSSIQDAAIEHLQRDDGLKIVTVSMGIAAAVVGDERAAESLIERADRALYASKNAGRNRVSLSTEV